MADRTRDTNAIVTHYTRLIIEEQQNIKESYQKIAEYSRHLARVSDDQERKLLPRE